MEKLTAGELLRLTMKREKIKQIEMAEKLGIDKRNVSKGLKKLDDNSGNISTFIDYARSIGYEVEFRLNKIEKK